MNNNQTIKKFNKQHKAKAYVQPEDLILADNKMESQIEENEDIMIDDSNEFKQSTKNTKLMNKLNKQSLANKNIDYKDTNFFIKKYSHLGNLENLIASNDKLTETDKVLLTRIASKLDKISEQRSFDWGIEDLWSILKKRCDKIKDDADNWLNFSGASKPERILGFSKDDLINYFQIPEIKKFKTDYLNKMFFQSIDSLVSSVIKINIGSNIEDKSKEFSELFFNKVKSNENFLNSIDRYLFTKGETRFTRKNIKTYFEDMRRAIDITNVSTAQNKVKDTLKTINELSANFKANAEKDTKKVFIIDLGIKND